MLIPTEQQHKNVTTTTTFYSFVVSTFSLGLVSFAAFFCFSGFDWVPPAGCQSDPVAVLNSAYNEK